MVDNYARAYRWRDIILGKTDKPNYSSRNVNFYGEGDSLFSYGSHFPMVTVQRDKSGNPVELLRNGDRFSNTTTGHQSVERSVTDGMGLPVVTIPYSVLDEAGIIRSSVRIVEVTSDGWETINVVKHEFPEGAVWKDDKIVDVWQRNGRLDKDGNPWVDREKVAGVPPTYRMPYGIQYKLLNAIEALDQKKRGYHYGVVIPEESHTERNLYVSSRSWDRWKVSIDDAGNSTYSRSYTRHWLGASLVTANVRYTKRVRCSACKGTGKAPEPWRDRWAVMRWEDRHADWVENHERREAEAVKRLAEAQLDPTTHKWTLEYLEREAKPEAEPIEPRWQTFCVTCSGEKTIPTRATRKAYFLSAFDENESRPSYFFAELAPGARPKTVAEALESLKPEAVKLAEQLGRTVLRQGDIFAIPTGLTKKQLRAQGANFAQKGRLLRTNHAATETATLPDGTLFARGTMRHVPEGRRPDHKMVKLNDGKQYFVIIKNTVPVAR